MKVTAISDMHGHLPEINPTDLLLLGGDICPTSDHSIRFQEYWLDTDFKWWANKVPAKKILMTFGNHDFIGEHPNVLRPLLKKLPVTYLQDELVEVNGYKIWGSPWQLEFFYWAFNLKEHELAEKWALIPEGVDILLLHSPVYGYGDAVPRGREIEHVGSPSLLERIKLLKPKLTIFGHIHPQRGVYHLAENADIKLVNASLVDGRYQPVNKPIIISFDDSKNIVSIDI